MAIKLSDAGTGSKTLCPAGTHAARCYQVIDLGTHTTDGQYGTKTHRKIRISWELPDELHTFIAEKGPEPFAMSKTYNFLMGDKATLRKDLESWRGRAFTEDDLDTFTIDKLIGSTCLLNVVHEVKAAGTYANVLGISPLPKAMKATMPEAILPPVYYEVTQGPDETFMALPEWLRKMISACAERNEDEAPAPTEPTGLEVADDDIPF